MLAYYATVVTLHLIQLIILVAIRGTELSNEKDIYGASKKKWRQENCFFVYKWEVIVWTFIPALPLVLTVLAFSYNAALDFYTFKDN